MKIWISGPHMRLINAVALKLAEDPQHDVFVVRHISEARDKHGLNSEPGSYCIYGYCGTETTHVEDWGAVVGSGDEIIHFVIKSTLPGMTALEEILHTDFWPSTNAYLGRHGIQTSDLEPMHMGGIDNNNVRDTLVKAALDRLDLASQEVGTALSA